MKEELEFFCLLICTVPNIRPIQYVRFKPYRMVMFSLIVNKFTAFYGSNNGSRILEGASFATNTPDTTVAAVTMKTWQTILCIRFSVESK